MTDIVFPKTKKINTVYNQNLKEQKINLCLITYFKYIVALEWYLLWNWEIVSLTTKKKLMFTFCSSV
jgi:hypothetical protein